MGRWPWTPKELEMLMEANRQANTLPHTDQAHYPLPLLDPKIHTKARQFEDKRCGTHTSLKDDLLGLETDHLGTPYYQVFSQRANIVEPVGLRKKLVVDWLEQNGYEKQAFRVNTCGMTLCRLRCPGGHEKYVKMYCQKEYCPTCGAKGSWYHKKRVTRARDRLLLPGPLGYLVFTLPAQVSTSCPDIDTQRSVSKKAWDITAKNFGTPGGVCRTHLMGNTPGKFHNHINVLFPITTSFGTGVVDPGVLDQVRAEWTAFINGFFDLKLDNVSINYDFSTTAKKKGHRIKYVFRPIVNDEMFMSLTDEGRHYIMSLTGWHNTRWFGKLSNSTYKEYLMSMNIEPDKEKNEDPSLSMVCPCGCGKFKFVEIVHKDDLPTDQLRWLDCDTLVDRGLFSAIKEREESLKSSHV